MPGGLSATLSSQGAALLGAADAVTGTAATTAAAGAGVPDNVLAPVLILVLCVIAGIGTVFLLPARREAALRKIGGIIVLAAALILAALLVRYASKYGGMSVYFWIFSAVALGGSLRVVTHRRPVYSALYFVLTVFASAGLFVLLWAEFMAAALVLIYAGAILVTYVFVIMLATQAAEPGAGSGTSGIVSEYDTVSREPLVASAIGFALMGVLLFVIFDKAQGGPARGPAPAGAVARVASTPVTPALATQPTELPVAAPGSVQAIGRYLFEQHLVNLELAGLILTIGMVGAILIARRRVVVAVPEHAAATVAQPSDGPTPAAAGVAVDDNPHTIPVYGTQNPRAKAYPQT